jgi:hypothetical protein
MSVPYQYRPFSISARYSTCFRGDSVPRQRVVILQERNRMTAFSIEELAVIALDKESGKNKDPMWNN